MIKNIFEKLKNKQEIYHLPNFITNKAVSVITNDLERIATSGVYGVSIYWSPRGTGKTTNLKYFASKMNSNKKYISNVNSNTYYLNAHCSNFRELFDKLYHKKNGNNVIIIDDYDVIYNDSVYNYSRACSLAESSSNEKINKYIISVSNPLIAKSISNFNGGEKFYTVGSGIGFKKQYIWSDDDIKMYVETKIGILKNSGYFKIRYICFDDSIKKRIIELGNKSKNPLFIDFIIDTYIHKHEFYCSREEHKDIFKQEYDVFATMCNDQWEHGIKYLNRSL
jgi:hypothetical protein